uniref:legumain n=1 Tax=Haemonchus contortus TaxID=6289 RepID=A0A7I4YUZ5_HAECO|nr:Peptidase C13 domain containing protein [Haemonchus contortus]
MKVLVTISLLISVAISVPPLSVRRQNSGRNLPKGELHALLVAGSKGWYNYRHQANVAHAYHVLLEHGVPAKNIIVMMYDDIANHKLNPHKGKLFNKPNGPDVYSGLKIDYNGDAVSAENFLAVLKGDRDAVKGGNGRVIESNENDRIFVYYTDLGATGLMAFPSGMLMARQLNQALEEMHENRKYSQMVFYLAACESGSIFKDLLSKKTNVYAVTSANEAELEFATYCEDELELPCLGDEFSVNWMEDSDKQDISLETLDEQFEVAKGLTFQSEVSHYGNLSIADEPVGWFHSFRENTPNKGKNITQSYQQRTSWSSRDVELLYLQKLKQLGLRPDTIDDEIFIAEENHSPIGQFFAILVYRIVHGQDLRENVLFKRAGVTNYDCHEEVVRAFYTICSDFNKHDYALKYMFVLSNLCTTLDNSAIIIKAMNATCLKDRSHLF